MISTLLWFPSNVFNHMHTTLFSHQKRANHIYFWKHRRHSYFDRRSSRCHSCSQRYCTNHVHSNCHRVRVHRCMLKFGISRVEAAHQTPHIHHAYRSRYECVCNNHNPLMEQSKRLKCTNWKLSTSSSFSWRPNWTTKRTILFETNVLQLEQSN